MNHDVYADTYIREILNGVKSIAMVGASPVNVRPSYFAFKYLAQRGYDMIPVNPGHVGKSLLDKPFVASLREIGRPVDMIDIFRNSSHIMPVVEEALQLKPLPKIIWMQLGARDDAAAAAAFEAFVPVLRNPRCMNCHPAGDHPLQGEDQHEHMPVVWRGETGHLETNCAGCHTERNVTLHEAASYKSIPGNPRWAIAPLSMAWQNKSLGDICRQLKDVERNGGRDLALLQEHVAKDDLVGWAWNPGTGREPAPGTQEEAGKLVQAWIDTGAECPQ